MNTIKIAVGSVAGRVHRRVARPNQDAAAWQPIGDGAVLVVCDGCGGEARSEVGAAIGARLWCRALAARVASGAAIDEWMFESAGDEVLGHLRALARALSPIDASGAPDAIDASIVIEHFMFTSLCAVIAGGTVAVHAIGDGVIALGDDLRVLGPFADNQPPYLAQALYGDVPRCETWFASAAEIDRVVIATDGAAAPGLPLGEIAASDVPFRNPHALTRRLGLCAEDSVEIDWDARRVVRRPAILDDDTTIAIARWSVP